MTVTGDQKIQTCPGKECQNQAATPGIGLLPFHAQLTTTLIKEIQQLVSGATPLSRDALAGISPPGVMISTQVIRALQRADANQQGLLIDKLASNIATTRIDDMANLAIIILHSGRQVPAIRAATPAHEDIEQAIQKLDKEMELLTRSARVREQFVTHLLVDILEHDAATAQQSTGLPALQETIAPLQDGAMRIEQTP